MSKTNFQNKCNQIHQYRKQIKSTRGRTRIMYMYVFFALHCSKTWCLKNLFEFHSWGFQDREFQHIRHCFEFLYDIWKIRHFHANIIEAWTIKNPMPFWIQNQSVVLVKTTRTSTFAVPCLSKFAEKRAESVNCVDPVYRQCVKHQTDQRVKRASIKREPVHAKTMRRTTSLTDPGLEDPQLSIRAARESSQTITCLLECASWEVLGKNVR